MYDERYANTKGDVALVSFYKRTVPHVHYKGKERVVEEKEVDFIHIRTPGDQKTEIEAPVTDDHKKRFSEQWRAYELGQTGGDGTPLKDWDFLTSKEVEFLTKRGIASVEYVAHWPDANIDRLGPNGFALRKKAQEFLDGKEDREEMDDLKAQIAELKARLDSTHTVESGIVTSATTSSPPSSAPTSSPPPEPPPPEPEPEPPGKGKGRDKPKPPKGPRK